jgi:hypothetical protein
LIQCNKIQYNVTMQYRTSWNVLDTGSRPSFIVEKSLNILARSSTCSYKLCSKFYVHQLLAYMDTCFYLTNLFITKQHFASRILFLQDLVYVPS